MIALVYHWAVRKGFWFPTRTRVRVGVVVMLIGRLVGRRRLMLCEYQLTWERRGQHPLWHSH